MTLARLSTDRTRTFKLLNYTPDGSAVLLDEFGRRTAFQEATPLERVEVCCDTCGEWKSFVVRVGHGWACLAHEVLVVPTESWHHVPACVGAAASDGSTGLLAA
jgi:hypothetical protein